MNSAENEVTVILAGAREIRKARQPAAVKHLLLRQPRLVVELASYYLYPVMWPRTVLERF